MQKHETSLFHVLDSYLICSEKRTKENAYGMRGIWVKMWLPHVNDDLFDKLGACHYQNQYNIIANIYGALGLFY